MVVCRISVFVSFVHFVVSLLRGLAPRPWFAGVVDVEGEAAFVGEGFDGAGDFEDGIADGGEAECFVRVFEELGLHHAGSVGQGEELHLFAVIVVDHAVDDDEAAGGDLFAQVVLQFRHRTVALPRDVGIEGEGMVAGGEAEEIVLRL